MASVLVDSNGAGNGGPKYPLLRGLVLLSQIVRAIIFPAAVVYGIIWRDFILQPVHVWFIATCVIIPILIEQGVLRAPEMTALIRAVRGQPDPIDPAVWNRLIRSLPDEPPVH